MAEAIRARRMVKIATMPRVSLMLSERKEKGLLMVPRVVRAVR